MSQKEISKAVPFTLRTIYLKSSNLRMVDSFDPTIPGQNLGGKFKTEVNGHVITKELIADSGKTDTFRACTFVTHYAFRYIRQTEGGTTQHETEEEEEARLVAEISADIVADYLITSPEMPPQDALESWGKGNVLLHTWPYWREYCHASMSRMSLPVTMMPLLQLTPPKPEKVFEE